MTAAFDKLGSRDGSQCRNVILLAEDDDDVRAWLSELLTKHGYEVLAARNGFQALMAASEYQGSIDLLLTDVDMPVLDGYTLARIMIEKAPPTELVFMSGSDITQSALGNDFGFDARLIRKPFDDEAVLREVKRLLPVANDRI